LKEVIFDGWGKWVESDINGSTTYELGLDYNCVGILAMSRDDEFRYDNDLIELKKLTKLYPCSNPECHFKELITFFNKDGCSDYPAFTPESEYGLSINQAEFPTFVIRKILHIEIKECSENPSETPAKETKPINQNSNSLDFSGLLNNPLKKDDWFCVIDDMTRAFHAEFDKIPNEPQAWGALWTNPPEGYEITTGKVQADDCLFMPGTKPLSKSSFTKRWSNYTTNKP
jgi:hypothetical protein